MGMGLCLLGNGELLTVFNQRINIVIFVFEKDHSCCSSVCVCVCVYVEVDRLNISSEINSG